MNKTKVISNIIDGPNEKLYNMKKSIIIKCTPYIHLVFFCLEIFVKCIIELFFIYILLCFLWASESQYIIIKKYFVFYFYCFSITHKFYIKCKLFKIISEHNNVCSAIQNDVFPFKKFSVFNVKCFNNRYFHTFRVMNVEITVELNRILYLTKTLYNSLAKVAMHLTCAEICWGSFGNVTADLVPFMS